MKSKVLVILGPTATGKSDLAVKLSKKFQGEVISADSRQVYKGLDIGTGKITKKEMLGVPHHMLDIVSPKKVFTVSEWKKQAEEKIEKILAKNKLPIICGGTAFYIKSVVDDTTLPEVPPSPALRKKLEKKSAKELFSILKKLDPRRAKSIDINNPVRLIRAIEIAKALGKAPTMETSGNKKYRLLIIGLDEEDRKLKKKIHERLLKRLKMGMVKEAKNLHINGLSWKRMRELGLEYRYLAEYLENKLPMNELTKKLETEIWHYVRRQRTWWKKDRRIKWFSPEAIKKVEVKVAQFLKK